MLHNGQSQLDVERRRPKHSLLDEAGQEMPGVGVEDTADKVESVGRPQGDDDVPEGALVQQARDVAPSSRGVRDSEIHCPSCTV